ncbi:1-acyl-sn-glycerol-3-phosphate acyltransferase [Flavilitoribacter nigricans]|uniref:Glycerol acyltransferase n=1 Tax=Flavilitoribacter nigricans (strain ATCC 23147 / DSM 23189 / NBRC 102662 / NCIMB 1420 / SS-2) TaxID=1122177 RepID=A0A2D0MYF0_FLAN2|nr:1-acyl-sn-glycerol-3-phosphate acyltransferase [Flavilitoribacter nigricans]PHN01158.1 glycerol acyltransferase [Flavilitoribacter nigricans DSM 23189 = NBRC 102662]
MQYEDIRPYYDNEYQSVIKKLLQEQAFLNAIHNYFPEYPEEQIKAVFLSCQSIRDFQQRIVSTVVDKIIKNSLTDLNFTGIEALDPDQTYLFMSNHRDIVLDSAFLNYGLNKAGLKTSEIAIGSNLLGIDWVRDLVRINKSFIVKRNLPNQEMLEASKTLSAYIDYTIHEKGESIWIAQREGRAKDGNDKTNPGLLKMLGLGVDQPLLDHLMGLNIVPVSISYEYDPCDNLKIPELIAKSQGETYTKKSGEDVYHMLCGIQGFKGRVQVTFGRPIRPEMEKLTEIRNRNMQLRGVANIIDQQIYHNYRLWANNYIAADLLRETNHWQDHYTEEELANFQAYIDERLGDFGAQPAARRLFLEMYANPVFNHAAAEE